MFDFYVSAPICQLALRMWDRMKTSIFYYQESLRQTRLVTDAKQRDEDITREYEKQDDRGRYATG